MIKVFSSSQKSRISFEFISPQHLSSTAGVSKAALISVRTRASQGCRKLTSIHPRPYRHASKVTPMHGWRSVCVLNFVVLKCEHALVEFSGTAKRAESEEVFFGTNARVSEQYATDMLERIDVHHHTRTSPSFCWHHLL